MNCSLVQAEILESLDEQLEDPFCGRDISEWRAVSDVLKEVIVKVLKAVLESSHEEVGDVTGQHFFVPNLRLESG